MYGLILILVVRNTKTCGKKNIRNLVYPTMKPYDLIKRLIECSTKEGDIVLDIFMGTGSKGYVCNKQIGILWVVN